MKVSFTGEVIIRNDHPSNIINQSKQDKIKAEQDEK